MSARRLRKAHRPEALERFKAAKAAAADGRRTEAIEAYRRAIELEPEFSEAYVNLGVLYGQMGDGHAADALQLLHRATALVPTSARAHYNLGVVLSKRRGRIDEAIKAFETAVAIDPLHRNALYALAVQWNKKGDPVRAAAYHRWYQEAMSGRAPAVHSPLGDVGRPAAAAVPVAEPERPVLVGGTRSPRLRIRFRR